MLRGVQHVLFFAPPSEPRFFGEVLNMLPAASMSAVSTVLHTRQDALALGRVVGAARAKLMAKNDKDSFMLHYNAAA